MTSSILAKTFISNVPHPFNFNVRLFVCLLMQKTRFVDIQLKSLLKFLSRRKMSSLPSSYSPPDIAEIPSNEIDEETKSYGFSHTMIRIRDPKKSLDFYRRILGMKLIRTMHMPQGQFTNYFLCYPQTPIPSSSNETELNRWLWNQQGILELCHNWGTELENSSFEGYKSGNEAEHKGFGHLCVFVDNLIESVRRFDRLAVQFKKRPEDGQMKHIAFILDPDRYWIEIIEKGSKN